MAAPAGDADAVAGDMEEVHRRRAATRGLLAAWLFTVLETLDMTRALLVERVRDRVESRRIARRGQRQRRPGGGGWHPGLSRLDFVLGLRMLVRYPGLTVLGGLAMAFAIFVGAGTYEFLTQVARPNLPLPDGDEVVGIRLWHTASSSEEEQTSFDLAVWREQATTLEHVGAFRTVGRNLTTAQGPGLEEVVAQMSASGWQVAGVEPALGRIYTAEDQLPGAPAVMVIGHEVWQRRFGGDPGVIGTTARLGDEPRTIIGVMPEGFAFPVTHSVWTPHAFGTGDTPPREGPELNVIARLADGAGLDQARRELERLGLALSAEYPATHEHMRPQIMPYARMVIGGPQSVSSAVLTTVLLASNIPILLFVVLVAGNVALLLFARAAAREGEMVVRSALGASRARIIGQLFAEALVLAALAAMLGLAAVGLGMRGLFNVVEHVVMEGRDLPFWFHAGPSLETVLYTALLTLLVAAVAGGLPGLKVTRGIAGRLKAASAGGGGFRFGGIWTALIVTQIAVMVNLPILGFATRLSADQELLEDLALNDGAYLAARVLLDNPGGDAPANAAYADEQARRYATLLQRLDERLTADPRVAGVTFTERLPRQYHPWRQIEVEGGSGRPPDERGHRMGSTAVALDYFDVMATPMLEGRNFHSGDPAGPGVVIVTEGFAHRVLGGQSPVGRRIRYLATEEYRDPEQDPGPWLTVVGVVPDLGTRSGYGPHGIFHPVAPDAMGRMHAVVHVAGAPAADFAADLRAAALAVDPALRVVEPRTLDRVTESTREFYAFWMRLLAGVTAVSLILSLGGIYAVLAFTVAQRTREIGIRMALGSGRAAVVAAIFRRPLLQVLAGTAVGVALLPSLAILSGGGPLGFKTVAILVGYFLGMTAVCLTACAVPAMRVLRIAPSDALRTEG